MFHCCNLFEAILQRKMVCGGVVRAIGVCDKGLRTYIVLCPSQHTDITYVVHYIVPHTLSISKEQSHLTFFFRLILVL